QDRPIVLATTGGGEDGFELLQTFIEASRAAPWEAVVVSGPMAPSPQHDQLQEQAAQAGIRFHTFVPHLDSWFEQVAAVVCMSGYNTVAEALSRSARIIAVPRSFPRTEQLIRARLLAQLGLLQMIEPRELSPPILRERIGQALSEPRQEIERLTRGTLDLN